MSSQVGQVDAPTLSFQAPALMRRLASFLYEGVLLFGLLMIAGYLYSALTQMRHAQHGRLGLQLFLFVVLGVYFVWFWSRGGQTVAMKAWHIRLVDATGSPVSQIRALVRYLLSWLWFVPALVTLWISDLSSGGAMFAGVLAGVLAYAWISKWMPQGQFWHDVVCGTRLVTWLPTPTKSAKA
jgi:uncharacterized RDD family membrane protein YckC